MKPFLSQLIEKLADTLAAPLPQGTLRRVFGAIGLPGHATAVVAMLRDLVERHAAGNVAGLRRLAPHLLANAAGSFSVEKSYAALGSQGLSISKDTVHQLLG